MMIYVANPLYDAVFKYMMEDERIAVITNIIPARRSDGFAIRRKKRFDLLSRGICNPPIPSICRLLPEGWG